MDVHRLRCFLAVAETGHVTRAAARLGMRQPPLSQLLQALERELALSLFERHPKGMTLTAAGRELRDAARPLVEQFDRLAERMRGVAAGRAGRLAIAFTSSAAAHALTARLLHDCRVELPGLDLRISEANAADVIEAVAGRRVQLGFLRLPVARPPGVLFEELLSEPAVLAVAKDHPITRQYKPETVVPLQALAGERLVLVRRPGAPGLYAQLVERLSQLGVAVEVAAEVERMFSNLNLVAAGHGVSIVPASMRDVLPQSVAYRALPRDPALQAPLTMAWHRDDADPLLRRVTELARRIGAGFSRGRRRASATAAARC